MTSFKSASSKPGETQAGFRRWTSQRPAISPIRYTGEAGKRVFFC